ncbi:hypothetical protein BST97_14425 [Nonlabens spongiae]|uniref:Uncharacterized protein n=1 Tax=Nonlabens spongiae TaxID=331648 RepID=A0A1W6MNB4_9FLAO|nr:hypothetical protein [Nonlabens spongiae]ARN79090.1 hypothetical protein BST97_14425 [Nonlabens spongiae]
MTYDSDPCQLFGINELIDFWFDITKKWSFRDVNNLFGFIKLMDFSKHLLDTYGINLGGIIEIAYYIVFKTVNIP